MTNAPSSTETIGGRLRRTCSPEEARVLGERCRISSHTPGSQRPSFRAIACAFGRTLPSWVRHEEDGIDIAVLVSGSGSNLQALIDASATASFRIVVVISDRAGVRGLTRAEEAGIATAVVPWAEGRDLGTANVCDVADAHGAESMVLAGFMRILGPEAVRRFPHRILNVHPSLLPAFPGAHAVDLALEHGVKLAGVTVHFVDEKVDHGPIIDQRAVDVLPDDDRSTLHARIQAVEHEIFPKAVEAFADGRLEVVGRKVVWS